MIGIRSSPIPAQPDRSPGHWSELERFVPGVRVARTYQRSWLVPDLVAGVVLTSLLVPQGMAYAELAGLPAVTGLYTTVSCLLAYAVMGPSRILVLGPDSSVSPMILAAIVSLGAAGDPAKAIELAGMLAILVAALELVLGLAKLGFVADLLSKEVKVGYLNGLAIVIIIGQLPKLFGFSTDASGFIDEVRDFFANLDKTNGVALATGLLCLAALFVLPRVAKVVPAVLVVIVGATVASHLLHLADHGVKTVGALPQGFPRPELPWTRLDDVGPLAVAAIGITLVSLTDTIATSSAFAARHRETVSANQEMIGIGCANAAAGFFQGFAISSSASRTAVAESARARTQLTGVVGAGLVVVLLLFLNSILAALPQTVLAAVVIAAAVSLTDLASLRRYWTVRRGAVAVAAVASAGVILLGVLDGILCAIGLSIILFFRRNWWPHGEVLARRPGTGWHAVQPGDAAGQLPGVVVFRWEAPLFFANSGIFRRTIADLARSPDVRWIVLQCEAVTDIDVTAADMLAQMDTELNRRGVHIAFVELRSRLNRQLARYGLFDEALASEHFYGSVEEAIAAISGPSERPDDRAAPPTSPPKPLGPAERHPDQRDRVD
ncbi:MAG TPA: sulfate permease [Jatrophihabitans sp.]|nr:sulfate permease [Jatrophihabitans sp.]